MPRGDRGEDHSVGLKAEWALGADDQLVGLAVEKLLAPLESDQFRVHRLDLRPQRYSVVGVFNRMGQEPFRCDHDRWRFRDRRQQPSAIDKSCSQLNEAGSVIRASGCLLALNV
jgi:hypothetical protein